MNKDEALNMALEALEKISKTEYHIETPPIESLEEKMRRIAYKAITAIKEALAQPEHEPVAWYRDEDGIRIYYETKCWDDATPLYTAPQRKPLTDEEIILIVAECAASHQHTDIHFARAIERAHGIKENK